MKLVPSLPDQRPAVTPRSLLIPDSLLAPPPCLPSITPSVLMEAIGMAMVDTKHDEKQISLSPSSKRWDRTLEFQYDGGTRSEIIISGDAEYGPITKDVGKVILTVMSYWAKAGYPRVLPMTIKELGEAAGINRKRIRHLFNAAAALKITGKVRSPETGDAVDINAQPFSGQTDGTEASPRISGIAVDEQWRMEMGMGLHAFLDLEVVLQLQSPLALRMYLYLAGECARGKGAYARQSGELVRPEASLKDAFAWHRRLLGYDLVVDTNTARFYRAMEDAIAELKTYGIVSEESHVSRTDGGRSGPLFTKVHVQFGAGLDVLSLLRASTMADSTKDQLLLTHLVGRGITIPIARKLLAFGHERVIRVLLQVYYRQYVEQKTGGEIGTGMVVSAIMNDYTYATDLKAREWAWELAHPAPTLPAATRDQLPEEPAAAPRPLALKDHLATLNRQRRVQQESFTVLVGGTLLTAEVEGDRLVLTHSNAFDAQMSAASRQATDVSALWQMVGTLGLPVTTCVVRNDMDRVIRSLDAGPAVELGGAAVPPQGLDCPVSDELRQE